MTGGIVPSAKTADVLGLFCNEGMVPQNPSFTADWRVQPTVTWSGLTDNATYTMANTVTAANTVTS